MDQPGPPLYMLILMGIIAFLVICGTCLIFGVVCYRLYKRHRGGGRHPHIYRPPMAPYNDVSMTSTLPIVTHDSNPVTVRVHTYSGPHSTGWTVQPPPPAYNPNYPNPNAPPSELSPFRRDDNNKNNSFG